MDNEDLKELNAIFKDMGGVEKVEDYTSNFEELPDGTYLGEIEKVSTKNSKNTGRPMMEIVVAIEDGKKEYVYLMLAGKDLKATQTAVARAVTQLKKLGIEGTELSDFISGAESLVGKRINLKIETRLNGQTMQSSNTDRFIFRIERLISYLSQVMTLKVGDLIFTGTPNGVGDARRPPVYLKRGDEIVVEIEKVGVLTNPIE